MRERVKPKLYYLDPAAEPLAPFRAAVETAACNLGLDTDPPALAPEHWQRVLVAVETRMGAEHRGTSKDGAQVILFTAVVG